MIESKADWMKSGEYLPEPLRDFHDQKKVFRSIHTLYRVQDQDYTKAVDWVAAQVYTIDKFLWFMAQHGYTLQRSRKRFDFGDLHDTVSKLEASRRAQMAQALGLTRAADQQRAANPTTTVDGAREER